jgi:hypothetical protein
VRKVVREEVFEARMKDERKLSIIVKNLPEDKPDLEAWSELVSAMSLSEIVEVKKCSRIGQSRNDGTPRPLKVECTSSKQKQRLLQNSKILARAEEKFRVVYLHKDLTQKEQAEQKQLRDELKKVREENPGKKYVIRKNRVVEVEEQSAWGEPGAAAAASGGGAKNGL